LAGGNAEQIQLSGWSAPEPDHTWSIGNRSALVIDDVVAPHGFFLEIDWQPFSVYPHRPDQAVIIIIGDRQLSPYRLALSEIAAFYCPAPGGTDRKLLITFDWPDASQPSEYLRTDDPRVLAVAFRRLRILPLAEPMPTPSMNSACAKVSASNGYIIPPTPAGGGRLPLRSLASQFEMLAGDCALGLALRTLGVEQLSLLRFAGATTEVAIRGLENDFQGVGEQLSAQIADNPIKEWMVSDAFGLRFHTHQSSAAIGEAEILQRQRRHIAFLRRKFLEDLELAEKIFVYADQRRPRTVESALPLFLTLNRRGRQRMLWVCPNVGDTAPGRVDELLPGFARASLDTFDGPLEAGHITVSGWVNVLFNAATVLNRNSRDSAGPEFYGFDAPSS
jgi:hypothetical protein